MEALGLKTRRMEITSLLIEGLSISLTTTFIPDLAHENLYIIMKQFQDFILNLPLRYEKDAKIFFASCYRKYVDILSNHDVYIWLAAYREANFNYLLQSY
jgi:hypothetical protein